MADPVQTFLVMSSAPSVDPLIDERRPAFVFDRTGTRLLFANAAGFAFLGGEPRTQLSRALPATGALARRLSLAASQLSGDRTRNDRLPLTRGLMPAPVLCSVARVTAGNDRGVAVIVLEAVSGPALSGPPREAFEALLADLRGPVDAAPTMPAEASGIPGDVAVSGTPIEADAMTAPQDAGASEAGAMPVPEEGDVARGEDAGESLLRSADPEATPSDVSEPVSDETAPPVETEAAEFVETVRLVPAEAPSDLPSADVFEAEPVEAASADHVDTPSEGAEEPFASTAEANGVGVDTADGIDGEAETAEDFEEVVSEPSLAEPELPALADILSAEPEPGPAEGTPSEREPGEASANAAAPDIVPEASPADDSPVLASSLDATSESTPATVVGSETAATPAFSLTTSGRAVRFVFELDSDAAFRFVSGELAETLGPAVTPSAGETWPALAERLALDPLGRITSTLSRRDTFTGLTVAWPVEANALRVPVDLAGMPVFGRDRSFGGYRGFGIARTAAAYEDETAPPATPPAGAAPDETGATDDHPSAVEPDGIAVPTSPAPDQQVFEERAPDRAEDDLQDEVGVDTIAASEHAVPIEAGPVETVLDDAVLPAAEDGQPPSSLSSDTADAELYASPPSPDLEEATRPLDSLEPSDALDSDGLAGPTPESTADEEPDETFVPLNDVTWVEAVLPLENPTLEGSETLPEGDLVWEDRPAPLVSTGAERESTDTVVRDDSPAAEPEDVPFDLSGAHEEPDAVLASLEPPADEPTGFDTPVIVDVIAEEAPGSEAPSAAGDGTTVSDDGTTMLADVPADAAEATAEQDLATAEAPAIVADDEPVVVHDEDTPAALLDPQSIEDAEARLYGLAAESPGGETDAEVPVARGIDGDEPFAASADEAARALYGDLGDTNGVGDAGPLVADTASFPEEQPTPEEDDLRPSADIIQSPVVARPIPASPPPSEEDLNRRQLSRPERDAFQKIAEALGARVDESVFASTRGPESHDVIRIAPTAPVPAPRPDMIDASVLDRLPVPLAVLKNGDAVLVNRAFLDLAGYASAEALEEAGGFAEAFAGSPVAREQPLPAIRRADGSVVPVTARLHSVPFNDGMASLIVVQPPAQSLARFEPTTEESGRVRELEAMLDTATDGVLVIDDRGTIVAANRSAEALFGAERAAMNGVPLTELLAPESHRSALDYLDGLSRNGVASVLNDGREVIGRVRKGGLVPLFMTMGRVSPGRFCAVLRDITQWKRAEEELTAAKRSAETASSQKSDFLAKISHEIRTPLNAIIGFSEVMMEERFGPVGSERYKEYLRDIHMSGALIMSLVNDLLDLSKIEAGKLDLSFEAVSLNDVLRECVALMQPQANRDRVIIRTSLSSTVPNVVADPRSLRQIVLNLLSNAIKYNMAGGQVIVSTIYEETGEVAIRVRDTGPGMSADDLERALEPFRQLQTTQPVRGTGLGLPLTKALVEANRASFRIDSTVGQGTLVQITFPSTRVLAE